MDKKNDIVQTYRRREDEFHLPLSDGGWEELEKTLASRPVVVRRTVYRWWAVAAAVLLCVVLSVPLFIPNEVKVIVSNVNPLQTDTVCVREVKIARDMLKPIRTPVSVALTKAEAPVGEYESIPENERKGWNEVVAKDEPAEVTTPKRADAGPQPEHRPVVVDDAQAGKKPSRKKPSGGWSFGIGGGSGKMTSGLVNSGSVGGEFNDPTKPDPDPDPDEKPDVPVVRSYPQLRTSSYEYMHRLPLSVAFSVRKKMTDVFALESGLSYTYLYSDIRVAGGYGGYVGSQRLHYLGVPLKANWTVYRKGLFSLYLSGGFMAEYCVSARRQFQNEWSDVEMNRWQFSLNAAVGGELRLFHPLSIYLEPGIGYYFDNGNTVPTIRKERPWLVGFQLGLRLSY